MTNRLMIDVLLVEDNRLIAFNQKQELEKNDFRVLVAHTKEQVFEILKEHAPEVVIMDVNLNDDINGVELMIKIHEKYGFVKNIFITGYSVNELQPSVEDVKPLAILEKPVRMEILLDLLCID